MSDKWNMKNRLVTCLSCKIDRETDEVDPKCPTCKRNMITVTFSLLTGERLTGAKESLTIPTWEKK